MKLCNFVAHLSSTLLRGGPLQTRQDKSRDAWGEEERRGEELFFVVLSAHDMTFFLLLGKHLVLAWLGVEACSNISYPVSLILCFSFFAVLQFYASNLWSLEIYGQALIVVD